MARRSKCPVEIIESSEGYTLKVNARRYGRRVAVRVYKIVLHEKQLVLQHIVSAVEERIEKRLYKHEVEDAIAVIAVEIGTTVGRELTGVVLNVYPVLLVVNKEHGDYVVRQLIRELMRAVVLKVHEILDVALSEVELWLDVLRVR
jgi:hypothetical protein